MDSVWWNGERYSCLLKVTGIARHYVERGMDTHIEIVETDESYDIVRFYYHNEIELFAYVKSWIPYIRIIENDTLAKRLEEEVRGFLDL